MSFQVNISPIAQTKSSYEAPAPQTDASKPVDVRVNDTAQKTLTKSAPTTLSTPLIQASAGPQAQKMTDEPESCSKGCKECCNRCCNDCLKPCLEILFSR